MKILMINSVCGVGSTGRICTDLAEILEQQGHQVKIAYGRGEVAEKYKKYAVRIGSNLDVKVHALTSRLLDCAGFCSRVATKSFISWIKEYDPDVIHLHNIHGYYINVKLLFDYLRQCNKKICWTLHDCWAYTGHCAYYSAIGCFKWRNKCIACPQKKSYPKSMFLSRADRNFETKKSTFVGVRNMILATPSKWLANEVKQSFLKDYSIRVIPNGIDLKVFKPTHSILREKYGLENKKVLLGVASVWDERKGLNDFIRLNDLLGSNYKIVLIGLSEVQQKTMPKDILCISKTNNVVELAQWYTVADVFLNPSVEETMGLTTVEAMACGTSVITYNRTAVPEVVDDACGVVVDCSPELMAQALERVPQDSSACTRRAELYEKAQQYMKYIQLYME